jgi:hypothetical protein
MGQSKPFIEWSSEKLFRNILASDKKYCRLLLGILIGHCSMRHHLYITDLLESTICKHEEESSYNLSIFSFSYAEIRDLWLCITRVNKYEDSLSHDDFVLSIRARAFCRKVRKS